MELLDLLKMAIDKKASDVFISVGTPPSLKIDGQILPLKVDPLTHELAREMAFSVMTERQKKEFEEKKDCNFALVPPAFPGRFRMNVFQQQGMMGLVGRRISDEIPNFADLRLPSAPMEKISLAKRGLVLFVGGTGSGKSTSQAACIDYRNQHTRGHIITIEDPVEYTHTPKHCIITQREVGIDTVSFGTALENAMRQSPDVIQIGEIRTAETMETALSFAETGHLCLATLHANNAYQAVERMSNLHPDANREQVMMGISLNLRAIISQRLIPLAKEGGGRVAAVEIMICTTFVRDLIMKGEIDRLSEAIEGSSESGMQTFDQSLFGLHEADLITRDDALRNAESASNLGLRFKLEGKSAQAAKNLGSTFENVEGG